MWPTKEPGKGGGARPEPLRGKPYPWAQTIQTHSRKAGGTRGGSQTGRPAESGCPGPDPRPAWWSHPLAGEAPRPSTHFLPGAGPAATS